MNVPHLKDIAKILTSDAYLKLIDSDVTLKDKRYIYLPKKFEYGKTFFYDKRHELPEPGFVVMANEGIDIKYISFILNSIIIAFYFCGSQLSKPVLLSLKKLSDIPLREADEDTMFFTGLCNRMVQVIYTRYLKYPNREVYEYHYKIMSEIRDALAMEHLTQPLFENLDIHIFEKWIDLLFSKDDIMTIPEIVNTVLEDNNELMNQIRKMRIVITNIGNLTSQK